MALAGCTQWRKPPAEIQYDSPAARQLLRQVMDANADLVAFKGVGRVRATLQNRQRISERMAWIGAAPGRLRFAFLTPTGMPVLTMGCDEEWVTVLNHTEGKYIKRRVGRNSLSGFLPVSIRCTDFYRLLVGRPPQVEYESVRMVADAGDDADPIVLLLQRRFRGTVGRISVSRDTGELVAAELLDVHGNRLYSARVDAMQTVEGYRLPARITLTGTDGTIALDVQRAEISEPVTPDLFRIVPPQADGTLRR